MKVFAVSQGSYSDYGILDIFSTREKAEYYIKINEEYGNSSDMDIEEYELDPVLDFPHKHKFKYFFWIEMDKEGNILHAGKSGMDILKPNEEKQRIELYGDPTYKRSDDFFDRQIESIKTILKGWINADSVDHAIKIMGEKRSYILASNLWEEMEPYDRKELDVW